MILAATYTRSTESGVDEIHSISAGVVSAAAWLRGVPRDDEDEEEEEEDKKHDDDEAEDEDDDGEGYSE
jgi:ribosomal protein L12E/L44/L45/RPP1/RPP2